MKINEAEKIAEIIGTAEDQHNSATATVKIRRELCDRFGAAFPDFKFTLGDSGAVKVEKRKWRDAREVGAE